MIPNIQIQSLLPCLYVERTCDIIKVMKKYLGDFSVGLIIGLIALFSLFSFIGDTESYGGWLSFDFALTDIFIFGHKFSLPLLSLFEEFIFVTLGIIPFVFYTLLPFYKKRHDNRNAKAFLLAYLFFSLGIFSAFFPSLF